MDIKGFAHLNLTVSDFNASLPFYKALFNFLGLKEMFVMDNYYYCVGRRVGMGIQASTPEHKGTVFDQGRCGLHHLCFSMEARADVDALGEFVRGLGAKIIREPSAQDEWMPGMYSMLFEDPDGIRLEANHIQRPA